MTLPILSNERNSIVEVPKPESFPSQTGTVLVVDDEPSFLASLKRILERAGWKVFPLSDPSEVMKILDNEQVDLVVTDVRMPQMSGIDLCRSIRKVRPDVEVVMMTGAGSVDTAVEAMKAGAYDFLTKPFEHPEVPVLALNRIMERRQLARRNEYLETQETMREEYEKIIGSSSSMRKVFSMIENVASTQASVLITGESGTGKELVAKAIHKRSPRSREAFLAVNCAAFTESLLESELFGHTKGAFTGAAQQRRGLFEEATGGTLFLDEIGETSPVVQVKLLRALQEGEIRPVGSSTSRKVDVRIIAATNLDLSEGIRLGTFRKDLFYRINVVSIALPALRDRRDDIPILAHHFLRTYAKKQNKTIRALDRDTVRLLTQYDWPGNVRELENVIERAIVVAHGSSLQPEDLPTELQSTLPGAPSSEPLSELPFAEAKRKAVAAFERTYVTSILAAASGVIAEGARLAHMDRSNFRRLVRRYRIPSINNTPEKESHGQEQKTKNHSRRG